MKKVGPCKIIAKYGANAYKVDLLSYFNISSIFNVENLTKFKGPLIKVDTNKQQIENDATLDILPPNLELEVEKILDSRVKKTNRYKVYMEHLIKWKYEPKSEATRVVATNFMKLGIVDDILSTEVT